MGVSSAHRSAPARRRLRAGQVRELGAKQADGNSGADGEHAWGARSDGARVTPQGWEGNSGKDGGNGVPGQGGGGGGGSRGGMRPVAAALTTTTTGCAD